MLMGTVAEATVESGSWIHCSITYFTFISRGHTHTVVYAPLSQFNNLAYCWLSAIISSQQLRAFPMSAATVYTPLLINQKPVKSALGNKLFNIYVYNQFCPVNINFGNNIKKPRIIFCTMFGIKHVCNLL